MIEKDFQDAMVATLRGEMCAVIKFRDESTAGIPDLFVGAESVGFWVELKVQKPPKRPTTPLHPDISGQQTATLIRLHRKPCPSGVLTALDDGTGRWVFVPTPRLKQMYEDSGWACLPYQTGKVTLKALCHAWRESADWCAK